MPTSFFDFFMPAGMATIDLLGLALFVVIIAVSLGAIFTIGLIAHSLYCARFHRPRRAERLTPCDAVKERIPWSAGEPSSYWDDDDPNFIVSKHCRKNARIEKPKCNMHRIRFEYGNLQRRPLASADADTKQRAKKTEYLLRKSRCKKISKLRHRRMPKNYYVNDI